MDDLISRQAAIDWLKNEWDGMVISVFKGIENLPSAQPEPITVNIDHELTQEEYEKLRKDMANAPIMLLPAAQSEQRWTPCSEGSPEKEKEVFVYLFGDSPYIAWVDKNGVWNTEDFEVDDDNRPVAWMPLPEPWKGAEE